jgi:ADP-heptose:LPS heptosyltransferase
MSGVKDPILILQMLRMGDLILSYPLFLWLSRLHPENPIWVVGSPAFFKDLLPVSPRVTYFSWEESGVLAGRRFFRVINISHLAPAAELAGSVRAEEKLGPVREGGHTYIRGVWQLYRSSLTRNNRHNRFHWAELNALDSIPLADMGSTRWPVPRTLSPSSRSIGLFLGASEPEKRPTASFWAGLVRELLDRSMLPILMGGPDERELGVQVAMLSRCNPLNLCGTLSLAELAKIGQTLQLMITPDTGPMHLASWTGVKVLNLSMGPVNPWETGPYCPGQYVLVPDASCRGCWVCSRKGYPCREQFRSSFVASLARRIVKARCTDPDPGSLCHPGLALYRTARDQRGLYELERIDSLQVGARERIGRFWHVYWALEFGLLDTEGVLAAEWEGLRKAHPQLAERFTLSLAKFGVVLSRARRRPLETDTESFWHERPPLLRPFSGYLQHFLQNNDRSDHSFRHGLAMTERLLAVVNR